MRFCFVVEVIDNLIISITVFITKIFTLIGIRRCQITQHFVNYCTYTLTIRSIQGTLLDRLNKIWVHFGHLCFYHVWSFYVYRLIIDKRFGLVLRWYYLSILHRELSSSSTLHFFGFSICIILFSFSWCIFYEQFRYDSLNSYFFNLVHHFLSWSSVFHFSLSVNYWRRGS